MRRKKLVSLDHNQFFILNILLWPYAFMPLDQPNSPSYTSPDMAGHPYPLKYVAKFATLFCFKTVFSQYFI